MRLSPPILIAASFSTHQLLAQAWQVQWRFGNFPLSTRRPFTAQVEEENICRPFKNGRIDPTRSQYLKFNVDVAPPEDSVDPELLEYMLPTPFTLHQFILWRDNRASVPKDDKFLDGFLFYVATSGQGCNGDPSFYLRVAGPSKDISKPKQVLINLVQDAHIKIRFDTAFGYYRAVYRSATDTIFSRMVFDKDPTVKEVKIKPLISYNGEEGQTILIPKQNMRPTAYFAKEFLVHIKTMLKNDIKRVVDPNDSQKTVNKLFPTTDLPAVDWGNVEVVNSINSMHDSYFKEEDADLGQPQELQDEDGWNSLDLGDGMLVDDHSEREKIQEQVDLDIFMAQLRELEAEEVALEAERQAALEDEVEMVPQDDS